MSKQTYSKAKGRSWEQDVCDWLRAEHGIQAERRRQTGADDCGDVAGWSGVVVEAKACKTLALAEWLDECNAEILNAARRYGAPQVGFVLAKRKGRKNVDAGYALMAPWLAVKALKALREKEATP